MSRRYASAHPCPTPSKRAYVSIELAARHYWRQVHNGALAHLVIADRAYRCQCGKWHRTKRNDSHLDAQPLNTFPDTLGAELYNLEVDEDA